jgi:hypothetical protein
MTTELEKIRELLNSKLQKGIIKKEDFEILEELVIRYAIRYKDYIENIHYFVIGLVDLIEIGYDEKDISTILTDISNLGIKEIDKALFEVSIYIYKRYDEEFRKYFEEKSKSIKRIIKSSPNIDNILHKLEDKIKVLFNDNDEIYIEIENSIENTKKCNILSLSYILYYIIQNWQNDYYIEKVENIREQISCTIKNLENIKSNLENILKDLGDSRYIKEIQNIKRELDIYYNGLLNIIKELDTYKQSYIEFKKEYLPKLLFEGLDYIKGYININSNEGNINKNHEQNILYH